MNKPKEILKKIKAALASDAGRNFLLGNIIIAKGGMSEKQQNMMVDSIIKKIDALLDDNGEVILSKIENVANLSAQDIVKEIIKAVAPQFNKIAESQCQNFNELFDKINELKLDEDKIFSKLDNIEKAITEDGENTRGLMKSLMTNTRNEILVALQSQDKKIDQLLVITEIWLYTISGTQWNEEARQKMLDLLSEETKKDLLKDLLDKIEKQTDGKAIIGNDLAENENVQRACDDYVVSETAVAIIDSTINQTEKKSESQEEIDRLKKDLDEALKRRDEAEDELRRLREGLDESAGRIDKEDYGLDAWDFSIKKNKVKITAYRGWAENLTIPASISGRPVVSIAGGTFKVNSSEEAKGAGSSIREVIISDGIAAIDSEAFSGCDSLETITIPASIRDLGSRAFCNCGSLLQINYNATKANDLSSEGIFVDCGAIGCMEIIFGDSVEHIPANLCNGSHNLVKVTISSNVKTIGKDAFKNCESLTIYCEAKSRPSDWPDDWNSGCPVVWDCLSNNVAENGYINIFDGKIRYEIKDDSAIVARQSTCLSGDVEIPESISYNGKAYKVIRIAKYAFSFCKKLESITIPDSVTSIGDYAFSYCSGLTDVQYQGDLSGWLGIEFGSSSSNPMSNADNLYIKGKLLQGELVIPEGTDKIGDYAFKGCNGLTRIILPKGVTSIGDGAFLKCASLNSITIPASVKCIGKGAFFGCYNLSSIDIPKGVTNIGKEAFSKCTGLESITIPDSVEGMGSSVFKGCFALKMIYCQAQQKPNGWASDWNPENRKVTWYSQAGATSKPNGGNKKDATPASTDGSKNGTTSNSTGGSKQSVTPKATDSRYFDYKTYKGGIRIKKYIGNAKDVVIPSLIDGKRVTSIGNFAFLRCTGLTSVTIPDSVTSIGDLAFSGCTGLTSITIPDSVTSIGDFAFSYCTGLKRIIIPDSVKRIGEYAFDSCGELTIYCEAARKPLRWSRQWNPDNRPVYWGQIIGGTRAKKNTGFLREHKLPIVLIAAVIIALIVIIPIAVHFSERVGYDLDENGTLTIYGSRKKCDN